MALYLRYAVRSDLGLVRNNNEDSVYAGPRLLAIADGMGGHAAGEVASKIVIGTLEPLDEDRRIDDLMGSLRDAVVEANHRIADAVTQRSDLEGMGTTLTALRFLGSQVGLVHVGDSRAYLMRGNQLTQITHDDTYVQYLVDSGKLTPDEAKDHPRKSVILRALLGTDVEPDVSIREARHGDRYLLCSDGLSDVVSTETISDTLQIEDPQECADRLVELALRGGGPDNVTVIVADVINARVGDRIDDVPVIAGAFVDPAAADVPGADSAAERAARMSRPPAPEPVAPKRQRRRFHWRAWLVGLGIVALVVGALGGTYAWTQTQYFVGKAGADVAIYRGVNTEFGPLKFFNVYKVTNLPVANLQSSYRGQVEGGITAHSKREAQDIVDNLRKQQLPACLPGASSSVSIPPPTTPPPTTPPSTSRASTTPTSTTATSSRTPSRPATSSPAAGAASTPSPPASASSSESESAAPCPVPSP
jgi:PPM family protein phosphatase